MDAICLLQEASQKAKVVELPNQQGGCAGSEAVCTRWNSWFDAVKYHTKHVHLYRDFLLAEDSTAIAVKNILSLVETEGADPHSQANLHLRGLLQTDDIPDHPGRNPQTHSSVCI